MTMGQAVTIIKTQFSPTFHSRRIECWAAKTSDGRFTFERLDGITGTPWQVIDTTTGEEVQWVASLPKAKKLIDSGALYRLADSQSSCRP